MTALAAPAANFGNKGPIAYTKGRKTKASQTFYAHALACIDTAGYLVPGASTAGLRVAGVVDLDDKDVFVSTAVDGADTVKTKWGVFPFKIGTSTDALTIADLGNDVFVMDDQTVGRTDGAVGRPVAGHLVALTNNVGDDVNSGATYAWVSVGGHRLANQGFNVGKGSVEAVAAPGAISVATEITTLAVDGTDAYTLANGLYKGQRKVCVVISGANTPIGTITPATPSGFATVTALGAVGDSVEFIWTGAAWVIASSFGCTFT